MLITLFIVLICSFDSVIDITLNFRPNKFRRPCCLYRFVCLLSAVYYDAVSREVYLLDIKQHW